MNRYERLNQERKLIDAKKRVAAYCRVSTDNEDQANSFESQQRYFRQYIERNPDWELYEIFADEGISGTNTKKRKEFNRMIACAKNGDFDLIITKEISRFARNTLDSIYYTRDLKKHGVGVIFMNDNINTCICAKIAHDSGTAYYYMGVPKSKRAQIVTSTFRTARHPQPPATRWSRFLPEPQWPDERTNCPVRLRASASRPQEC